MTSDAELRRANIELASHVITTCGNLQAEKVREDFTEDAVLSLPYAPEGQPTEIVGRDQIIDYIALLADYLPPGSFSDHTYDTMAGDPNVVISRYTATTKIVANGQDYENSYVTLITIRDGKVAIYQEYFDPINWLVAIGGSVTPASA